MPMSRVQRRRVQVIYRSKRIALQSQMIYEALLKNVARTEILERVSAARYSVNKMMVLLLEEEVLDQPRDTRGMTHDEIVDSMMEIAKTYID